MSTTNSSVVQFPYQVEKKLVFTVQNQDDLDYLNSKEVDGDFIADCKELSEGISLKLYSVDDVQL